MNKKNVIVLYGGVSAEHEISKISAANIISNIPEEKYNIIPVYITKDGRWLLYDGSIDNIRNIRWDKLGTPAFLSPDRVNGGLLRIVGEKVKAIPIDVVFPVLHGKNGEDGNVQGLFELSGIPYVGCGVLASAVMMDKSVMKLIVNKLGINQAAHITFTGSCDFKDILKAARYKIGYPCFVKPACSGSSVGISTANNKKALEDALRMAFNFDRKVIVEKEVKGRELECALLSVNYDDVKASGVGEVIPDGEFYDYEAKYISQQSKTIIPADIPEEVSEKIRDYAVKIFKAIDGFGLARADFFWDEANNTVIFNEINSMPGFTAISMYSKLWEQEGHSLPEVLDILLESAENRW